MNAPNFSSLLDKPSSEIERPKPLPQGTYDGVIVGLPRIDKSAKKQTEFSEYTINLTAAGEDVDVDELQAMGGIAGKSTKVTFYHTENSLWRLKDFFDHCGAGDESMTLRERMEETTNKPIRVYIKHEPSQDGTSIFARVDKTLPVE